MARVIALPLVDVRRLLQSMLRQVDGLVSDALISLQGSLSVIGADAERRDKEVNRLEKELQERIVSTFVRYQPVARDHHFLITMMGIVHDLEHMGDCAKHICAIGSEIGRPSDSFYRLAQLTRRKASECFRALHRLELTDIGLAAGLAGTRQETEDLFESMLADLVGTRDLSTIRELQYRFLVASDLKGIADYSTSIADQLLAYNADILHHPGRKEGPQRHGTRQADAIDSLYRELRHLTAGSGDQPGVSAAIDKRLAQLRELQQEEALAWRRRFESGLNLKPGSGLAALQEAKRLLATDENPSLAHKSAGEQD